MNNAASPGGLIPRGLAHRSLIRPTGIKDEDGRELFVIATVYTIRFRLPKFVRRCQQHGLLKTGKQTLRTIEEDLVKEIENFQRGKSKVKFTVTKTALEAEVPTIEVKVVCEDEAYDINRAKLIRGRLTAIIEDLAHQFRELLTRAITSSANGFFRGYYIDVNGRIRFRPSGPRYTG